MNPANTTGAGIVMPDWFAQQHAATTTAVQRMAATFTMPRMQLPAWLARYGSARRMVADTRRQLRCAYGRRGANVHARFMHAPLWDDLTVELLTSSRAQLRAALAGATDAAVRAVLMAALEALDAGRPVGHNADVVMPQLEISPASKHCAATPRPAQTPPMVGCAHARRHLATLTPATPDADPVRTAGVTTRAAHVHCGGTTT